jgi:hypothetical protein
VISQPRPGGTTISQPRPGEGRIGVPKRGGPLNSTGVGLLNHQTSKISINSIWMKFLCRYLKFEGLKVELGSPSVGDPLIPPGRAC